MIMSTISSAPSAEQGITGRSWAGGLAATMKRWWADYMTWRIEQAAIAQLWSMNDRELKDLGLSRSETTSAAKENPRPEGILP
jgi:uncharacterized protein YjiS (DUF1127 family)